MTEAADFSQAIPLLARDWYGHIGLVRENVEKRRSEENSKTPRDTLEFERLNKLVGDIAFADQDPQAWLELKSSDNEFVEFATKWAFKTKLKREMKKPSAKTKPSFVKI